MLIAPTRSVPIVASPLAWLTTRLAFGRGPRSRALPLLAPGLPLASPSSAACVSLSVTLPRDLLAVPVTSDAVCVPGTPLLRLTSLPLPGTLLRVYPACPAAIPDRRRAYENRLELPPSPLLPE